MTRTTISFTRDGMKLILKAAERQGSSVSQFVREAALMRARYRLGHRQAHQCCSPSSAAKPWSHSRGTPKRACRDGFRSTYGFEHLGMRTSALMPTVRGTESHGGHRGWRVVACRSPWLGRCSR